MVPAPSYDEIRKHLQNYSQGVRLVGLLFARPDSPLARAEVIESLPYFHYRSGERVDFFFAGYGMYWENWRNEYPDQRPVTTGATPWLFSASHFNRFRAELERLTRWQYSGGVDLILANAVVPADRREACLDFSSAVVCQLDYLRNEGVVLGVGQLFEQIFRFAEDYSGSDPAWGFSDAQGFKKAAGAVRRLVLALFPKDTGKDIERIASFAVRDIARIA